MLSLAKTAKGYPIMHLPTLFIILFAKSLWTLWIYCRYPSLLFLLFLFLKSLLHNYNFYSYYCHRFWWVVVVVIDPSACHACPSQIPPPPSITLHSATEGGCRKDLAKHLKCGNTTFLISMGVRLQAVTDCKGFSSKY